MYPTLKAGDHIDVCKRTAASSTGQIVVFRRPPREDCGGPPVQDIVKRVIGLPGETIQGKDGVVYINGKRLAEPWLPSPTFKSSPATSNFGPLVVPNADYFMMGDDRTDSCDSRDYGPVPSTYIIGEVATVQSGRSSTTSIAPTTTTAAPATDYPITVGTSEMPTRAPTGSTPTGILVPATCHVSNGTVTATGTFNGSFVPESFIRIGDMVELYVYTNGRGAYPGGTQLATLNAERPYPMSRPSPWNVSVPLDQTLTNTPTAGPPVRCVVTVQPTHAFMGAGEAGG